ncbi:MAG: sel1 repeat family protein, partial [Betaproteobacteria bacterium]
MTASLRKIVGAALIASLALAVFATPVPDPAANAGWQAYERGDYASALAAYEAAAKKGDRLAQFNLGVMLLRGEGKPVDLNSGIAWLTKAADAGMVQAQYNLGLLYESGIGVPRSLSAATEWWQKAAEQGHTEAQVQLA